MGVGGKMVNVLPNVGRDVEVVDSSYSSLVWFFPIFERGRFH